MSSNIEQSEMDHLDQIDHLDRLKPPVFLELTACSKAKELDKRLTSARVLSAAKSWRAGQDPGLVKAGKEVASLHRSELDHYTVSAVIGSMRMAGYFAHYLVNQTVVSEIAPEVSNYPDFNDFGLGNMESQLNKAGTFLGYNSSMDRIANIVTTLVPQSDVRLRRDCVAAAGLTLRLAELQLSSVVDAEVALHGAEVRAYGAALYLN